MYILSKIHKRLFDAPRRPVISNCRNPTGKCVNIFRPPPQPAIKGGRSYVKNAKDFLEKTKYLGKVLSNAV